MARVLRELFRSPSSSRRFITTFTHQNPSNVSPRLLFNPSFLGQLKFDHGGNSFNPSNQGFTEEIAHLGKMQIYPSFSCGFFVNPISPSGSGLFQMIGHELEQPGMMWADSVKRKRKKKMNKHKYKKLRKRLRRKTKT